MTEEDTPTDDTGKIAAFADDDALGLRFLAPAEIKLFRTGDALRMTIEGDRSCLRVVPFYTFPHSVRDRYISLRDMDGYELGIIRSLGDLDKDAREFIEEELRKRYVTPVIVEIKSISDEFDIVQWEVETDRGPRTFVTHSLYECLNESANSLIVTDMENNRYEIHDRSQLDSHSAAILDKRI